MQISPTSFVPSSRPSSSTMRRSVIGGVGTTGAFGPGSVELVADDRADGIGFGQAVAKSGNRLGRELLQHHRQMFRRPRRAAALHAAQTAQVGAFEVLRHHDFPGHGRHAVKDRNAFPLDQLQGHFRIPFVHHHELARRDETDQELGVATGHVKQGNVGEDGGLPILPDQFGVQGFVGPAHEHPGVKCADHGAMARKHALGVARRARGIHERGVVLRLHVEFAQLRVAERLVTPEQLPGLTRAFGQAAAVFGLDHDDVEIRGGLAEQFQPRRVDEDQLAAAVGDEEFQLPRRGP